MDYTEAQELDNAVQVCKSLFEESFGKSEEVFTVCAPGRVNLIGEHTDYNEGFVMPMAIKFLTVIIATKSSEHNKVRLVSGLNPSKVEEFSIVGLKPGEESWIKYVQGVVFTYLDEIKGKSDNCSFNLAIHSTVPLGGGLSSSASLEVAVAASLEAMYNITTVSKIERALRGVYAEHNFAKVPCGIMDQTIVSLATQDHALFLDCKDKSTELIPLPPAQDFVILVCNSNAPHELATNPYKVRVAQCNLAASTLGLPSLREAKVEALDVLKDLKSDDVDFEGDVVYRRARHVVSENNRVLEAKECLKAGNFGRFGELMYDSHWSLSSDFEVSTKELDVLVTIAREIGEEGGVVGSRMTGGGFGGCTVSLVKNSDKENVRDTLQQRYQQETGKECSVFWTTAAAGARVL